MKKDRDSARLVRGLLEAFTPRVRRPELVVTFMREIGIQTGIDRRRLSKEPRSRVSNKGSHLASASETCRPQTAAPKRS